MDKISAWMKKPVTLISAKHFELSIAPGVGVFVAAMVIVWAYMPTK